LATKIIAISQQTKADLEKYFHIPAARIAVILMSRPFQVADPKPGRLHLPDNFLLVVGRIEPRKNPLNIIRAFSKMTGVYPDLHLVFAGPATGARAVRDLAKRYGLTQRIHLLGFVSDPDLHALYHRARLLLFPSLYEGFGLPILEAFAYDLPVVTSDLGALKEVAGEAAVLVDPTSPDSIAVGVRQLLDNADARAHYVAMGSKRLEDFSWEHSAKQLLNLINLL
jgi:glycosyltransferase involved in cell wall biosynthesis